MGKNYLKLSPQNLYNYFGFFVKKIIWTKNFHLRRIVAIISAFQFTWAKMFQGLPNTKKGSCLFMRKQRLNYGEKFVQ